MIPTADDEDTLYELRVGDTCTDPTFCNARQQTLNRFLTILILLLTVDLPKAMCTPHGFVKETRDHTARIMSGILHVYT